MVLAIAELISRMSWVAHEETHQTAYPCNVTIAAWRSLGHIEPFSVRVHGNLGHHHGIRVSVSTCTT
jgi:hypothetical protein